ncbi:MAG TPA: peptidase S58 [Actinobacteria bacterium]|nr:peptidase S58 [Actinomycetota bacterium]
MITDVPGILVGHWTDLAGLTGCTVVLCPPGTVGSGEVRGGAPGTVETDLLRPGTLVQEVHAVVLTGGSAFGLGAQQGVVRYLEERGIGFDAGVARVPIVPGAVLFDLGVGDPKARPGPNEGYAACLAATAEVAEGNVGAGTGATVAKVNGPGTGVKGGVGTASRREGGLIVGAIAAVNALGEILAEDGSMLAAAPMLAPAAPSATLDLTDLPEEPVPAPEPTLPGLEGGPGLTNTTLVVVATNARMSKERAHLLALAAHDGMAAAIRPAHTLWDGDTAFALATGEVEADQRTVERLATEAVQEAIRRGVLAAESVPGFPAAREGRQA